MNRRGLGSAIIVGLATYVSAGPPFLTDDPQPVDFRHYEIYLASQYYRQYGATSGTLPHVEVNYGATPNLQLHLIAPLAYETSSGEQFNYGYGDTELGTKYRFVQELKSMPMVGIFPLVELPTGNQAHNLGVGRTAFYLPIWIQKSFGAWTTYGGGGFWHNPGSGNRDYWFSGLTVQCQTMKKLLVGAEVFHTSSQVEGFGEVTGLNFGGVYDLDEGHHIMFSIGKGIQGADHGTGYVAYQWTFGPRPKEEKKQK